MTFLDKVYFTDSDGMFIVYPKFTKLDITKFISFDINYAIISQYTDISSVNKAISNTEMDLIIFDDAKLLGVVAPLLTYQRGPAAPKIIVLSTWGDKFQHIDNILSLFNLCLVKYDTKSNSNVLWSMSIVQMSNKQLEYYNQIKSSEQYPLSKTRMVTLYKYPFEVNTIEICGTTPFTQTVDREYVKSLNEDGPKLNLLINTVGSHYNAKQIIFTRFNHYYGVDLIRDFLNFFGVKDVHTASCTDDDPFSRFQTFEDSTQASRAIGPIGLSPPGPRAELASDSSGILITNIIPLINLSNVEHIHVVDSYNFDTINALLDRCLNSNVIKVHMYIASHPNEASADEILYNNFLTQVKQADVLYFELIKNAVEIYT